MKATFIHPDLGIGGAERLVIDAAIALKNKDHLVDVITAHHDPNHCFPETIDGTLEVTVVGDWLPRSIFGRMSAICAYLRMIVAAAYLCYFRRPDIVFCDQISACIPLIRLFRPKTRILFYCHFPDQLLADHRTVIKSVYRYPLDKWEEWTTGLAHCICVNSNFTANVFRATFNSLQHIPPNVLYPTLNTRTFDDEESYQLPDDLLPSSAEHVFLSLNRFERKKNISLAIRSFAELGSRLPSIQFGRCHLIIAGGFDARLSENASYLSELMQLADRFDLLHSSSVSFVKSPDNLVKRALFESCSAVLYTPSNEHFGIVPLEAMHVGKPVIAVDSGGPRETILDGETGFLTEPDAQHFALCMYRLIDDSQLARRMGEAGKRRVTDRFGMVAFRDRLHSLCCKMCEQ